MTPRRVKTVPYQLGGFDDEAASKESERLLNKNPGTVHELQDQRVCTVGLQRRRQATARGFPVPTIFTKRTSPITGRSPNRTLTHLASTRLHVGHHVLTGRHVAICTVLFMVGSRFW